MRTETEADLMLLAMDIGNTQTDFGLFESSELITTYRVASRRDITASEAQASFSLFLKSKDLEPRQIDSVIISSVVPVLTRVYQAFSKELLGCEPMLLGTGLKTGLKVVTDNPKEVGADMIAASVGAKSRFGSCCLIVDFGTATKVFLLDKDAAFAGCTIGAGLGLQAQSLSTNAALLPEVSPQIPPHFLGKNTMDSMNSALTYGNAFAAKALCDAIEKEVGYPCKRVLTGGYSASIKDLFPEFAYVPNLVLFGLTDIALRNTK